MLQRLPQRLLVAALPVGAWLLPAPASPVDACTLSRAGEPDSAATCGKCHTEIHAEWQGRAHAKAWTDPVFQAALADKKRPELCYPCHIPTPVLDKLGGKPGTRDDLREEGVTCVSCHKKGDSMHGPFGSKTDAHPTEQDPTFEIGNSSALCASCHRTKIGPVLPLARDFEEAKLAEAGKSCVGCHMPEVERHMAVSMVTGKPVGEKRKTRRHDVLGPGDADFCGKAFRLAARLDGKDVVLVVENEAGHRVPGLTMRKFVFTARFLDGNKKELGSAERVEISAENELLAAEKREFRFAARDGLEMLEVEIEHFFADKSRGVLKKATVELE
ncbi:MAG: multiheme c-type cytochrome [Planctomycetota bacterium]